MRCFYILKGLFKGALTHKNFAILFDWFYPDFFEVVKNTISDFIESPADNEVLILVMKFLNELLDNSSNRLRFDTWSINGLIVYKESAALMIQLMEYFDCFSDQGKPLRQGNLYDERYKFVSVLMQMLMNCIQGNYINFAICEFYNDFTFMQLSQLIIKSILNQDLKQMQLYKKLYRKVNTLVEELFKKHLEMIMLRFDFSLILDIIKKILIPGMREDLFEHKSAALLTIDHFNEFVFNNLKKPSKKQP